jgi:hypothetical protein
MKLQLIKDEVCPTCKSIVVAESCRSVHCNGQGFEERTFKCGCVLSWSPNGERLEIRKNCPNSQEEIKKKERRTTALKKLVEYIDQLDVDEDWKNQVKRYL